MIKTNIAIKYPAHHSQCLITNETLYVADYTHQTKNTLVKIGTKLFPKTPPTDINYFSIINTPNLDVGGIAFDENSFKYANGDSRSQCECVVFPDVSLEDSWIIFVELKYGSNIDFNESHLNKARKQLFKTRTYYSLEAIFDKKKSTSYLIASLPLQSEPFPNIALTPAYLQNLKNKHNVIFRVKNLVEIEDNKILLA